mgnify:CR=1 FL=1
MVDLNKIKIDMVYTWVDNKDPKWLEKKLAYSGECIDNNVNGNCRYRDNDELKYSLRSLEKYANWINKIYIITDNQFPKWLNTDNKRVKIIDHSEIMPKECLPVFNSNAIEHCISNIQNLSEYYLYGNDDMFFANKVSPSYFYHKDGYPYCRFSYKFDKDFDFYNRMCANTDYLIEKKFGKSLKMFYHHNINAYRKSDVKNCIEMFKKEINETIKSRFRKVDNVEQTIYLSYALAVKHGHYKGIFRLPIYTNKTYNFFTKLYQPDSLYINAANIDQLTCLSNINKKIGLFCINDTEYVSSELRTRINTMLNKAFPQKSSFEK